MEQAGKIKFFNRLFVKVYFSFAAVIMLFVLILGIVYLRLYENTTMENYKQQTKRQAESIAGRCSRYFLASDPEGWMDYLILLKELEETEVWVLSNKEAKKPLPTTMSLSLENVAATESFASTYMILIENAFHNISSARDGFSEIHGKALVTVSVPVKGRNGEIAGAILINAPVETPQNIVSSSWSIIVMSSIIALIISAFVSAWFVSRLTKPILKMRHTALALAEGKYEVKTGIMRHDEIGQLARTIDFLTNKLLENEIERKNLEQMRVDFFANVSHELRTPITVVRAYTESLVDGVITKEEKKQQYYQRMLGECKSMERLVSDLLLFSKMQNPDFVIEKEPVNLVQIFDDLKRSTYAIGREKNIAVKIEKDTDTIMMEGDYDRLRQMFLVILDNAVKFSPENSTIYIKICSGNPLQVSIRDEGIGIAEEEIKNIFDKFYKSKLRQNAKGSGLGLAIAKQIATKHGGTIDVHSEVGVGTEFVFNFQIGCS